MKTSTKDKVLDHLEAHRGTFVSGSKLAESLGLGRNAVWKAVKALEQQGHAVESVAGKGYRLCEESNVFSATSIQRHICNERIIVEFHESIDSTNTQAKARAQQGAPEGTLIVANEQTAGRGRQGRPFYSPANTGVYFSVILRPNFAVEDSTLITTYAAVCTAKAIEELYGVQAQIKWVNDIFVNAQKICGILTEAAFDAETGRLSYVVVGIGINIGVPEGGFTQSAASIAGAISPSGENSSDLRGQLVAHITSDLVEGYINTPNKPHLNDYRKRSLLDGRQVVVYTDNTQFKATVVGVQDDFTLRVQLEDGSTQDLVYGEVHIPSSQL